MQSIALISGLIGAIASAILGFGVRLFLDKRAQKDAERRLAFVYLVKVSDVVAADIAVRAVIKSLVPADALKELVDSTNGKFGPSHKISAMLAEALQKLTPEEVSSNSGYKAVPRFVKSQLESAKDFKLTSEQLSKLPQDAVFSSNRFQILHGHVMQTVEMWGALFENDERYWVTPEGIHDQWMSLVRFTDAARELRLALIRFGAADQKHATALLSKQVDALFEVVRTKWADQPKLVAAAADSQKAANSEPAA